ncbi:MAG: cysteine methyltransferase [Acidobacteria bacterium]|nr:MAG: cysteine methyltransferase [Acidobacteriota bacterium]
MNKCTCQSPLGTLTLVATRTHLKGICFEGREKATWKDQPVDKENAVLRETKKQLQQYFNGQRKIFNLPLQPDGTVFQQHVWQALLHIPFGQTASYSHIARAIDNPKAVRAVGAANGRNPIPIVIPCHRVIGKGGALTGYAGGLSRKEWLLDHEKGDGRL